MGIQFKKKTHALGFIQADPTPSPQDLAQHYQKKYYQDLTSSSYSAEYSPEELLWMEGHARIAAWCFSSEKTRNTKSPSLFDVGCGEGFFANSFLKLGWAVTACDFSKAGIERHNPALLPGFEQGDIYQILERRALAQQKFDYVNLANVLEHVVDPLKLLELIRGLMHEKTLLRICVPNDFSAVQKHLVENGLTQETWFSPPEHLNYFNGSSLRNTLVHSGFNVERILADFPIEIFLLNPHSNYWADRTKGKEAHRTRVTVENLLLGEGVEHFAGMMEASAKCNFGRTLTAYVRPAI